MCMFSTPVESVASTTIFARMIEARGDARQVLVYAMRLAARRDLSMVLPIPVLAGAGAGADEDAVRFVDLSGYEAFFDAMKLAFPEPISGAPTPESAPASHANHLEVHRVGAFDASYVPTRADFSRLDPRFVLPSAVLDALPAYGDWGFAVFKLHADPQGPANRGLWRRVTRLLRPRVQPRPRPRVVHPMAFTFPTRFGERLFFPTVHVHDGSLPPRATFDHHLYFQLAGDRGERATRADALEGPRPGGAPPFVETSAAPLGHVMDIERARGLVDPHAHARRVALHGEGKNRDVYVRLDRVV